MPQKSPSATWTHLALIVACVALMGVQTWMKRPPATLHPGEFRRTPMEPLTVHAWNEATMNRTELRLLVAALQRVIDANRLYCLPATRLGVPVNVLVFRDGKTLVNPVVVERSRAEELRDHVDFNDQRSKRLVPTWVRVAYTAPLFLERAEEVMEGARAQCIAVFVST